MKEIRFAFVGFGNIAKTHMVALRAMPIIKQRLPLVPVLDTLVTRNTEGNRPQAEAAGFRHVTDSLEQALSSRSLHVVDVCTPNALHLDAVRAATQAGATVYCEKPLTDRYSQSVELAKAAASDLRHQVALVYRYHTAVMRMKEALAHNVIGDVLQCRCSYRRSGYLNAARPISWRLQEGLSGGGAVTDLGVHVLDLIRHLLGEIASVSGSVHTFVKRRPLEATGKPFVDVNVDDWAQMQLALASGVVATAEVSRIAWGTEGFEVNIVGTKGSMSCDLERDAAPRVKLLDGSAPKLPEPSALALSTDEKTTLGMSVDCHFAALYHFILRMAGEDDWPDLAPTIGDCLRAEELIDEVLRQNGSGNGREPIRS